MSVPQTQPMTATDRPCTCHPSDAPPVPCPRQFALTHCKAAAYDSLKARIQALEGQLQIAQELLAIIVNPKDHPNTSTLHLWSQCMETECKLRNLLQTKDGAK